ncbi:MAG: hypothetical protein IPO08_24360 [Xanthomonadales bacterium]|nr:hypothetical protein [Xanthomonadales bacterium]
MSATETGARQLAMVAADEKRKDPRYVDVIGSDVIGSNVVTVQQANLSLTIVSDTLQAMPELVALPKGDQRNAQRAVAWCPDRSPREGKRDGGDGSL